MKKPTILRRRYIPDETVDISGDEVLFRNEELLITRWKTIRPRTDISSGVSFAFLKEGIKISRFYDAENVFKYWYCDLIDVEYDSVADTYLLIDLLLDVKLLPDGKMQVLDADELADALERGIVTSKQVCSSLRKLDKLLNSINDGSFPPDVCKNREFWIE